MSTIPCPIWGPIYEASVIPTRLPHGADGVTVHSERAGGRYAITEEAERRIQSLNDSEKARLTTWLIDQRTNGVEVPTVEGKAIEYAKTKRDLSVHERAERLLRFLAGQTNSVGTGFDVNQNTYAAYAWSESIEWEDVLYFLRYLKESSWLIQGMPFDDISYDVGLASGLVTVAGHNRIAGQATNIDSTQAFVALWFNKETDKAYDQGIDPAIRAAGFKPFRIDREYVFEKIDDRIIAEIRRSRFLVADMTHGNEGARGSVYFEAGFAHGLGIPVIYTCRDDMFEKLHFDTRQYPHIGWKDSAVDSLRRDLENRIRALIGAGPQTTS